MNGENNLHPAGDSPLPSPSLSVRFYPFAGGGLLFFEGTRRLWGLNAPSAFLWCALGETRNTEELAGLLAGRFSIDTTTARRDTEAALSSFEREGLLDGGRPLEVQERADAWDIPLSDPLVLPARWAVRQLYRTPQHVIEFCCADAALAGAFAKFMGHLALPSPVQPHTRLAVLAGGSRKNGWDIYVDGRRFEEGVSANQVLPHLFTLIFIRSCEALRDRLLFHAAVMVKDGEAVVFPAEAGCGKTTLAAALAARGFRFFSDELAVLDPETRLVLPFPLPMSIKPGSVDPLEPYYPGLSEFPVHPRTDGKQVRYLPPPPESLSEVDGSGAPVIAMVFPRYRKGEKTRLIPTDKMEVLQRLAQTGSSNREFTGRDVEAMIALVENTPGYDLTFSNLEEGVSLLEKNIFPSCKG